MGEMVLCLCHRLTDNQIGDKMLLSGRKYAPLQFDLTFFPSSDAERNYNSKHSTNFAIFSLYVIGK